MRFTLHPHLQDLIQRLGVAGPYNLPPFDALIKHPPERRAPYPPLVLALDPASWSDSNRPSALPTSLRRHDSDDELPCTVLWQTSNGLDPLRLLARLRRSDGVSGGEDGVHEVLRIWEEVA